jgi:hypothetical protein
MGVKLGSNKQLFDVVLNFDGWAIESGQSPDYARIGSRPTSVRARNVQLDHLGISGGRIRANNRGVVFHP